MSKQQRQPQPAAPQPTRLPVNGVFHTAVKQSHLLYEAIEITVKDGVVTDVRNISRAPDLAQTAVAICQREIWSSLRTQTKESVLGE